MKNTLYLTKILLLNTFSNISFSKNKKRKKSNGKRSLIILIALFAFLMVPMVYLGIEMGVMFKSMNAIKEAVSSLLPMMGVMVVYFSIFGIISTFFLSSDIEILLSLPFKPKEILIAKFISSLASVYLIELLMFVPILLGIGIGANLSILFYINLFLVTILFPLIPISLIGIVITSLMRYTALNRIKDKIQYVIMIFIIIFAIIIEIVSISMGETSTDLGNSILSQNNTLSYIMFFTYPASMALGSSSPFISILYMILYILLSIGSVYLFALIGEKTYIRAVLGKPQLKINKKEKEVSIGDASNTSVFKEIVKTEYRTIARSPAFNMNLLLSVFIVPIILLISFAFSFQEVNELGSFNDLIIVLKSQLNFKEGYIFAFVLSGLTFLSAFSMISCTAISRDGKYASFYKYIPIDPLTIVHSKMFLGIFLSLIPQIVVLSLLVIINLITIVDLILLFIPLVCITILLNYLGIIIDLIRPKLDWENETIAVKQNTNTLIYMLLDLILVAIVVLFGVLIMKFNIPSYLVTIILSLIFGGSCVIIYKLLKSKGYKIFSNIG